MRIIIDIPEEFESDYKGDMFKDFFSRVLCDIQDGTICGNYEKEIAEMFLKAFDESIPMDKIVEQLEENSYIETVSDLDPYGDIPTKVVRLERATNIVKAGGVDIPNKYLRCKDCEYLHENGNCIKVGGFYSAVDDKDCEGECRQ